MATPKLGLARIARQIENDRIASRARSFPESLIREMTRWSEKYDALNLAQGLPEIGTPPSLLEAAKRAIDDGYNQYSFTWGDYDLREKVAGHMRERYGVEADADRNVTITMGSSEAMHCALLAVVDPGDEVVVPEPAYESYGPGSVMAGGRAVGVGFVQDDAGNFDLDEEGLKGAFGPRTKAIVLNTPNNPVGKVLTSDEMKLIADLVVEHDAIVLTDEIYEHMVYEGEHVPPASVPGLEDRTITISGLSKTVSVTGWRIGWAVAGEDLTEAVRRIHDFSVACAPNPFQRAGIAAFELEQAYYDDLRSSLLGKRDRFVSDLRRAGFICSPPAGAYYVPANFSGLGFDDDMMFTEHLLTEVGIGVVPGSSFYMDENAHMGNNWVRFTFCKGDEMLAEAGRRLRETFGS